MAAYAVAPLPAGPQSPLHGITGVSSAEHSPASSSNASDSPGSTVMEVTPFHYHAETTSLSPSARLKNGGISAVIILNGASNGATNRISEINDDDDDDDDDDDFDRITKTENVDDMDSRIRLESDPLDDMDIKPDLSMESTSPTTPSSMAAPRRPRGRPRKHPKPEQLSMVKKPMGRSKTGCITCRRRKKKCDERKPTCMFLNLSYVYILTLYRYAL
jgi:Zn(2)-Cys(6) binuclear cluster domain-containing protein